MANLFDDIQKAAFGIVTDTFGQDATWQPSDGSDYQAGKVLLKEPTKEHELAGVEYTPQTFVAEYHKPAFDGLYDAVAYGRSEKVEINQIEYFVRKVDAIWDGQTFRAILEKLT